MPKFIQTTTIKIDNPTRRNNAAIKRARRVPSKP